MSVAELATRLPELTLRDEERLGRRLNHARRSGPEALAKLEGEFARAAVRIERRRALVPHEISYPPELPVSARREDIKAAIEAHQVVVVAGETGSGKTTQLPKLLLELGRGIRGTIAHTQPRRLAARTVADRIAHELGVPLGEAVGYSVRFTDRSREDTLVRLLTDGLLLAEIQRDRLLRRYDTIIVDEAHERSLNVDFLLGYLKRILPQRPDLKLIITSATIDPLRFAQHFGDDTPVVEVSGRTYPVEVRYRPLAPRAPEGTPSDDLDEEGNEPSGPPEERDLAEAIGDAVQELQREGPGDILVFLSGEAEIRDTAEALNARLRGRTEVLPLYARLSSPEQMRVFAPHTDRRVVLATNVAETSLTVPGIHYVIDPGTARISRWSARLKVQRLPIEPVSQASADQRKGRCGRTADGICIRLYDEQDFEERPRFTDPEILRTSLASVILQMAALSLGDVAAFPFLDPPDRRQIRDGVNLLAELGALDGSGALTEIGKRLARLPVDPRMGRMVLEADRQGCATEVTVIVAALSIQDPRERPADRRAQADQLHARFKDDSSDFLALLNLWRYLHERREELSGNQFRKTVKAEFLHYLRLREWQDLVGQLRAIAKQVNVSFNDEPAEPGAIHTALLAGLLSHLGHKDAATRSEYAGARSRRFALFPGSALARRGPEWVMVAELVETSRLWGRTAARIDPAAAEALAGDLVRRSYSEPRWDPRRAAAVATERVTLYGLPIVAGRNVGLGRIDPPAARELFLQRALIEGEWNAQHAFLAENAERIAEVHALEERLRRRDVLVSDAVLRDFYDARIPATVVSGAHFDRWWRDERRTHPDLLSFPRELLIVPEAASALDPKARPRRWRQGERRFELSYRFDPGSAHDGVTVHVPLTALGDLDAGDFEWLVPALREELVTALLRTLPKDVRRRLVPAPEVAAAVVATVKPRSGPLLDVLAGAIAQLRGVTVAPEAFDRARLDPHLRMTFRVEDEQGSVLAEGQDVDALRDRLRPLLRERLAAATPDLDRTGLTTWPAGVTIPATVVLRGAGDLATGYPALVDEGATVGVRVLDTRGAQAAAMRAGTRRLLRLTVNSPLRWVQGQLTNGQQLALSTAPHASPHAALEDALGAALDDLITTGGGPAADAAGFARLRDHVAGELAERTLAVVVELVAVLQTAQELRTRLAKPAAPPLNAARLDIAAQLGRLVYPGFVGATGARRLADVERYLQAALRRLERLPDAVATDRDRMTTITALEERRRELVAGWPKSRPQPVELRETRWQLEELRVSAFAQHLGVRGTVSAKKVRTALDGVAAGGRDGLTSRA